MELVITLFLGIWITISGVICYIKFRNDSLKEQADKGEQKAI